jgi:hypothetical protein
MMSLVSICPVQLVIGSESAFASKGTVEVHVSSV